MAAYKPGQGIIAGSADSLRARKDAAEICQVCGERTEEGGLNCASVDDAKQWSGLLGAGGGNRKKARCSECTKPLPEDHDAALGPFCSACTAPPGWQAKVQATEVARNDKPEAGEDIQFGHLIRPGVCKRCTNERREQERQEARAKKDIRDQAREQALEEGVLEPPERFRIELGERPFGMTPSKADGAGYSVVKVSEGKPASRAGIRPGWKVVEVAGKSCEASDLEAVQALLKAAELPVAIECESVPRGADFCNACQKVMVWALFSRKMRTKPPDKRRCIACVDASGTEG